jgi:hypothetical protein
MEFIIEALKNLCGVSCISHKMLHDYMDFNIRKFQAEYCESEVNQHPSQAKPQNQPSSDPTNATEEVADAEEEAEQSADEGQEEGGGEGD